jgi:signal transduction histidine kinase
MLSKINSHALQMGNPYQTFGIFGVITYPFYYFVWVYLSGQGYENFTLRMVAAALCVPLIFVNLWPPKLIKFLPIYWYFTLWYCMPFLFTFFLLKNNFSYTWTLNLMTVLVLSVLLLDFGALLIILALGMVTGTLFFLATPHQTIILPANTGTIIVAFLSTILFGAIFAHRKSIIQSEKLKTINTVAESVAHELRTPLRTIQSGAEGIQTYLPSLIQTYLIAKEAKLPIPEINEFHYNALKRVLDNIISEVRSAFTFINILLVNANELGVNSEDQVYSIKHCIDQAIVRYPFDYNEKELVTWGDEKDFLFRGNEQLMIHVLFNLLKNALYYLKAANKGRISIWIECGQHTNRLYFKDTGQGISKKILPHIFDRFFSKTYHGTGIGLAFCKLVMKKFGGDITAKSIEGEYAEFIMSFPVVTENAKRCNMSQGEDNEIR